jgi:2-keto-4-pentenoate hydratase/2-oxohepta-3-ene-1,7-dioic acid hydratase in catechol pathway
VKIALISDGGRRDFAVEHPTGGWVPLTELGVEAETTADTIEQHDRIRHALETRVTTQARDHEVLLHCPVVRPSKMLAIGLNYMDHIRETNTPAPERPVLFAKFPNTLNDPYGDVVMDTELTEEGDYEAELAVIIGKRTRSVSEQEALSAVFGYAVANDVSARDWQRRDPQIDRSKGFDTFCPMGPWITTADEVPDPQSLGIRSWVNGEARQESSTKEMLYPVAALIHFLSRGMTLEPGDVILTGTPHGVGFAMSPPHYLVLGDVVRCEIDGLGAIENRIVQPPPR